MEEWTDSVRIAIDLFVACVIISALLVCINLGSSMASLMDQNAAAAADVKDYRAATAYEGSYVYAQDIVNLILTNQGTPEVWVRKSNATAWPTAASVHMSPNVKAWTRTFQSVGYAEEPVMNVVKACNSAGAGGKFRGEVVEDVSGGIKAIRFTGGV